MSSLEERLDKVEKRMNRLEETITSAEAEGDREYEKILQQRMLELQKEKNLLLAGKGKQARKAPMTTCSRAARLSRRHGVACPFLSGMARRADHMARCSALACATSG